ncbi:single-stranded-DNA-specific exonuclease RecJ, partial [Campylobacter coli]|nr:single-stranded-DNA-specific exonuclease RecJ [Campylobacter coli]
MKTIDKNEIRKILASRFEKDLHTKLCDLPLPCCLKDIYKAANRIKEAIDKNEKIAIVGDYDVDGIISCVIMAEFFDDIGFDYTVRIPNRFKDGYGLNAEIINELDVNLIITVDNGIAAFEAAKLCKEKNIDLIITDHHMPQDTLPDAFAIINPKQKDCDFPDIEICGAQVAWYLIAALKEVCKLKYDMGKFLELLAIAIVADMMELRDLNRALVRRGIECINKSKRVAFKAIKQYYQKDKFALDNIGFLIA